jgi:hypothetical protein
LVSVFDGNLPQVNCIRFRSIGPVILRILRQVCAVIRSGQAEILPMTPEPCLLDESVRAQSITTKAFQYNNFAGGIQIQKSFGLQFSVNLSENAPA